MPFPYTFPFLFDGGPSAPTHRRVLPRTLLSIDRWAEVIGLDPRHFNQVTIALKPTKTCAKVWKQYSWQEADQVGRYDVASAIQQAEQAIAQYLGYKLLPTWEPDERQQSPQPGNPDLFVIGTHNLRGYPQAVRANWGHVLAGGIEHHSIFSGGAAVTYTDYDGDGYKETATVGPIATTVTDEEEIAVYYPGEAAADEWEIRPLRHVTISAGQVTIKMWRHQLVKPDLLEALNPGPVDGLIDNNFLTTVDVTRRWNDSSIQGILVWHPNILNCSACDGGTGCCPICGQAEQDACLVPKNRENSIIMYQPAEYSNGSWTISSCLTGGRSPDEVRMWYRAGLQDQSMENPTLQMSPQWERAVAYYALSLLDRDICDCEPASSIAAKWREDVDGQENNPLGTTRAARQVWNMLKEPSRRVGSAVRY